MPQAIDNIDNSETSTERAARRGLRAVTVLGAVVTAVVVWFVAAVLVGVDLQVIQGGVTQSIGVVTVIVATVVAALFGWAVLAVLERFTRRPKTIWTVIAVLVTVLSLGGPFSGATSMSAATALALMHIAAGTVTIVGFRRSSNQ
ncbi:DUF6069 family protein [Amycolatopsis sp. CA-126428]|uniref:DUF6069 family protein n=1 Tax=Amycolatopsis sp. CA-126428 TaxID=2073158 RepID=UPI000CD2215B|nr:DUF6069 family protein [Amycolatopsis sp. CA-126428]